MSDYVIPRPDTLVREGRAAAGDHAIDRRFCQVVGRNRNHQSANGTQYHIQIEDLGPMVDHATRLQVRRVNLVVYANYGESNARIVYSRNYDLPDIRTAAQNRRVEDEIQAILARVPAMIDDIERREIDQIKGLVREYYYTKSETAKKAFEQANAAFPFLFSRAWRELKAEQVGSGTIARRAG